jgi:hypothetical protein
MKKLIGFSIILMLLLLTVISTQAVEVKQNHAPTVKSCEYMTTEILVVCQDLDGDRIRVGIDWDIDRTIDEWTPFCSCDIEVCVGCEDKMGAVEVYAEDVHGARSDPYWVRVDNYKPKNILFKMRLISYFENHFIMFPMIRQILELY